MPLPRREKEGCGRLVGKPKEEGRKVDGWMWVVGGEAPFQKQSGDHILNVCVNPPLFFLFGFLRRTEGYMRLTSRWNSSQ